MLSVQGALAAVPVPVVHPAAAAYVDAEGSADQAKRLQYEKSAPLGYAFALLSIKTFGELDKLAMALLHKSH